MRIDFHFKKTIDQVIDIDPNRLPFTYLKSYGEFLKTNYHADVVIAVAPGENIFIAMSLVKNKFITNVQLLSEPLKEYAPADASDQIAFLDELNKRLIENKIADRIIAPQNFIVFSGVPKESAKCAFGTYTIDLQPPIETIYGSIHPKHRNKISKAEREGVQIKEGREQLKVFYALYKATMERSNMHCESYDFYTSFFDMLTEKNCFCAVAYHNEIPQGAILATFTGYCCYYIYGASADNISVSGSVNYLHWHTMKRMKELNVRSYDFVGARLSDVSNTKLEGIQSFKERFGGELKKGYLFKKDLRTFKCNVYDGLVAMNNMIRGHQSFKDIIDQEIEKQ